MPASLPGGTYTVTWRVVSTDGHAIHGGFQFYVGAPSTISAVAVEGDSGAGRVVGWGYGAVRFAWYVALLAVIGLVVMRRFVWTPAVRAAGLADSDAAAVFRRRFNRVLPWAWILLLLAWLGRLVFQAASISGLGLADSARPGVLGDVLRTGFGRSWLAGLGFTAGGRTAGRRAHPPARCSSASGRRPGCRCWPPPPSGWRWRRPAWVTPARRAIPVSGCRRWRSTCWPCRSGSAAWRPWWCSGRRPGRPSRGRTATAWSARSCPVSAGWPSGRWPSLVATGTLNAVLDLAAVSDLWRTPYGRVLSAKIVLLAVALAFGAWHLWVAPRRLASRRPGRRRQPVRSAGRRRSELMVLATVVAFASALVALVPGRSLALQARGPVNQEQRVGAYTVQLFIDPSTPGANEIHVTFVDDRGLGAAEVAAITTTLTGESAGATPAPLAMRLISQGHFVGNLDLAAGPYRLAVETASPSPALSATFSFKLRAGQGVAG